MSVRPEERAGVADVDLSDRTVLVTGSSDGIGREAALALGRMGAKVLVHGRSPEKVQRIEDAIDDAGGRADGYTADFSSMDAVCDLATNVRDDVDSLDALANNAGTYFRRGRLSDAGAEATMTVNHLAPFLLTHRLLPAMPTDGRVVTTASDAHRGVSLDPDRLDDVSSYDGFRAYARSKLANILFTRELSRRLSERSATCYHPGFVPGSALWRDSPVYVRAFMAVLRAVPDPLTRMVIDTPATGAATLVYLVGAREVPPSPDRYYADCKPHVPDDAARDDARARALWERSEDFVDLEERWRLDIP